MRPILIDTTLLVYLYDQNEPVKQARAQRVLDALRHNQTGRLSTQALSEFVSAALRKLNPPMTAGEACEQVGLLATFWPVFDLTPYIVLEAARGVRDHGLAYYDAQIWASARLNQIPLVFSEDFQDSLTLEGIHFVNPFAEGFEVEEWV